MCVGGSGGGCCSDGRSFDGSRGSGHPTPTRDEIRDNLKVCEYGKNVLNTLFGSSEICIDKFDERKRVKVKTWSQDYKVFASTGVKIKSQKRRLRIWWTDQN